MKEIITRTITAFFLIAGLFLAVTFLPVKIFAGIIFIIALMAAWELLKIAKLKNLNNILLPLINGGVIFSSFLFPQKLTLDLSIFIIIFINCLFFLIFLKDEDKLNSFIKDFGVHLLIPIYLIFTLMYLFKLRELGANYLFFLIFVIAIGDSGAYFVGRKIGKHKIYPVASPKKSLEGLIAAIITAGLSSILIVKLLPLENRGSINIFVLVITAMVIELVSQISDPVESLFKRWAKVKDSGNLLPGHGGVLDRIDSYILCAPLFYYTVIYLW